MRMKTKINSLPAVAVFARNHRAYLEDASARNKKQPEAFTVFRAASLWTTAHLANQLFGTIKIYFSPIGGDSQIEYEAQLVRVKLHPKRRERDTDNLLQFSLQKTKNEGLWGKGKRKVKTLYVISQCKKLESSFPMSQLIKVSDDRCINKDFGYSYSVVYPYSVASDDVVILPDEIGVHHQLFEGAGKQVLVNAYERNPKARKACIDYYGYKCSVCDFEFEKTYGPIGKDYIHVHHLRALSEINARYQVDPVKDLRPICPNCHVMIHSKRPMFSILQLRRKLASMNRVQ